MKILMTMPNYDDGMAYLFSYSKKIIDPFITKDNSITLLKRPRLRKEEFTKAIKKIQPSLVLFNAHGDENTIYGDKIEGKEEVLIKEGINHNLLEGRLIYARACSAAASLGKKCTGEKGCFIGYTRPFSFWIDFNRSTNPLKDKTAELCLEPSNVLIESLIKGDSAKQAVEKSDKLSKKNILKILKNANEPGASVIAMILWNNMNAQVIWGDSDLRSSN